MAGVIIVFLPVSTLGTSTELSVLLTTVFVENLL